MVGIQDESGRRITGRQLLAGIAILVLFQIANLAAGVSVLIALLLGKTEYAFRVGRAMDCLAAAQIGRDGTKTISKECGLRHPRGTFCRRLCRWLDWADENHCEDAL